MAQADYIISNQTFPNTRADINSTLQAIATTNSGTSAPTTQYAGQFWIDTTSSTWTLYIHDGSDDIQFATIDTTANTVNFIDSALASDVVINTSGDITTTGAFTSVGIDDNATSTAITINSSNNVGIGIASPDGITNAKILQIHDSSTNWSQLILSNATSGSAHLNGFNINYNGTDALINNRENGYLSLSTNNTEAMRITSAGNVGIGTTSPTEKLEVAGNIQLNDNNKSIYGTGNDLEIYHDSSTNNNYIVDKSSASNYLSLETNNLITLRDLSTGTGKNGLIVNGGSTPYVRLFYDNNLKLKTVTDGIEVTGGVFLGGTAAANKLDDYEEGTWTPVVNTATGFSTGITNSYSMSKYTKIGNVVWVKCRFQLGNSSGNIALGDNCTISGLPFTPATQDHAINCHYRYNENNAMVTVTTAESANLFCQINYVRGTAPRNGGILSINFNYIV